MDAIERLTHDHRTLQAVFEEYLEHVSGHSEHANDLRARLTARARQELLAHAATEERALYPELRKSSARGRELADEAEAEHEKIESALAELARTSVTDPLFDAKVSALMEDVGRHVQKEEKEIFPLVPRSLELEEAR